jgi:tetratricopeptide (TPR) repeat protein
MTPCKTLLCLLVGSGLAVVCAAPSWAAAVDASAPGDPNSLILQADQYASRGDWPQAIRAYKEAIAIKPDSLEAQRSLADVYMLADQLAEARKLIDAVLRDKPNDPASLIVAGRIASREDKPEEALRLVRQAMALRPTYGEAKVQLADLLAGPAPDEAEGLLMAVEPADAAFERAMLLLSDIQVRRAQLDQAILILRRLLDFRPDSLAGRQALVYRYMASHQPDKAVIEIRELLKVRGQAPGLLVQMGDAQLAQNRFDDALDAYEKALVVQPDSSKALLGQTRGLTGLGRGAEAIQRIGATMNKYPDALWPRLSLAYAYEKAGDTDKAFEAIRTGVANHEDWEEGYVLLADMLSRAKKIDEARKVLQLGIEKVKESISIRTTLATLELTMKRSEEALKALEPLAADFDKMYGSGPERLNKLRPYMKAIRFYSLTLYQLGKKEEAVRWGMKLYALDPTDVANTNNMAWILANDFKQLDKAAEMIKRCLRLVPKSPQMLDTAGWIAFLGKNYSEAADYFQDSIKCGDNAEAQYHMGRALEELKRPQEAILAYRKAITMGSLTPDEKADAEKRLAQPNK